MMLRHAGPSVFLLAALFFAGCRGPANSTVALPAVGIPGKLSFVVEQRERGPIVLIFPGRSAPTDDRTLGIRHMAESISAKLDGSVAIFSWKVYDQAHRWVKREADKRRANNERVELVLVGHSWGGQAAGDFARESIRDDVVDRIPLLVTIDAICKGYAKSTLYQLPSFLTMEFLLPHRLRLVSYRGTPVPDGNKLVRHVNYYQIDSPSLCGAAIPTANENHEVWLDHGREAGHGNLDNIISEMVSEDVRRSLMITEQLK